GSFARYKKTLEEFLTLTRARPRIVLADKHPGYATSAYAQELARRFRARLVRIQHHRAHAFSVAAEHGLREFLAIVCDGLGWGDDDTIWGGEVFLNDERVGHLEAHTQLGGDAATREPARMLFSILEKAVGTARRARIMQRFFSEEEQAVLSRQLAEQFNSIATTSCGRVLDAAAVFLGLCTKREYDGRPAMLLEAAATQARELAPIVEGRVLLTSPLFSFLVEQSEEHGATQRDTSSTHKRDEWRGELAATVFTYLARGLYALARSATDAKLPVVFGGGCAYNRFMTAWLCSKGVLVNNAVPAGDGGIAFGQVAAYLANARNKNS
ncbi:carbamoyltransferase HypF, partial [Candidatus Woesearchaeota archaeon]